MKLPIREKIILASNSPRRKKLFIKICPNLKVIPSSFDEDSVPITAPGDYVKILSIGKANDVSECYPKELVVGADTIVSIDGNILGKPLDEKDALSMLNRLSGKTHQVYTGYTIKCIRKKISITRVVSTDVRFKTLNNEESIYYLSTKESFDKSGAYAIQGAGAFMIERINGSFTNVMGLPMFEIMEDLNRINIAMKS